MSHNSKKIEIFKMAVVQKLSFIRDLPKFFCKKNLPKLVVTREFYQITF